MPHTNNLNITADITLARHTIHLSKYTRGPIMDWYILVIDQAGRRVYDGYWENSVTKTIGEALNEAISGAEITHAQRVETER